VVWAEFLERALRQIGRLHEKIPGMAEEDLRQRARFFLDNAAQFRNA